ncbi:hypothetical protein G7L40_21070 [Paenibacillus polymyxa]|uniref:Uncharacterized protein n=1 Tax=Paenibacillus polymyxa TaxID=1406 RepID=A0A378XTS5_PAEPO|nr:hypothetical protein [Paenibacillus polymyxa]MBE7901211.1 hypothetical protein [Paenibacillus polymyxa]MBG9764493.1 hypothetical protein [Paenibacillus polymyxa]MBG9765087.1 hypothetical protein [Paenibacillus polymyxa]MBG9766022.1 hypothetical protein [Paenibacillus polymyxa]MBG9766187.1 hypothetical protein [Paenibacillus polymyxa]
MSERTVDLIRTDLQQAKNEAKKNILLPVREVEDLLALVDSLQQQVNGLNEESLANFQTAAERGKQLAERERTIARISADLESSVSSQLNMTDKAYRYQKALEEAKTAIQKNLAFANKDEQSLLSAFNHINKALGE